MKRRGEGKKEEKGKRRKERMMRGRGGGMCRKKETVNVMTRTTC